MSWLPTSRHTSCTFAPQLIPSQQHRVSTSHRAQRNSPTASSQATFLLSTRTNPRQALTFPPNYMLPKLPHKLLPVHPPISTFAARRSSNIRDPTMRVDGVNSREEGETTSEVERVGVEGRFGHGWAALSGGGEAGEEPGLERREGRRAGIAVDGVAVSRSLLDSLKLLFKVVIHGEFWVKKATREERRA